MLMTCCAYSLTHYGLHTQYMLLTHADHLLCLQLQTVQSPYTIHISNPCRWPAAPTVQFILRFISHLKRFIWFTPVSTTQHSTTPHNTSHLLYATVWKIMVLHTILTSPDVTVQWQLYSDNIQTADFMCLALTHTHTHTHTHRTCPTNYKEDSHFRTTNVTCAVLLSPLFLPFKPLSSTHISWPNVCKQYSFLQFILHVSRH